MGVLVKELEVTRVVEGILSTHKSCRVSSTRRQIVQGSREDHIAVHHAGNSGALAVQGRRMGMPGPEERNC